MKPVKIFEVKGADWLKGFSQQASLMRGGILQAGGGANPFETEGVFQPALAATEITAPVTNPIKIFTNWNTGGVEAVYGHSDSKLYSYLRNSPYTQSDVSAQIDTANTDHACTGAIIWKGRYVYSQSTDLRSNSLPVAIGNDVQILNGSSSSELDIRKLCIGADKNLYIGDYGSVGKCVLHTGTAGNALDVFTIDSDHIVRDIQSDGRYLVIFADNNAVKTTSRVVGNYSCRIYFWDYSKTTADIIYDIVGDSYIIGAHIIDGKIYVFTYNGIYICNSSTPPKLIWRFTGNSTVAKRPPHPYAITGSDDTIFWGDGGTNGQYVYAIRGTTVFSPYLTQGSTYKHTALKYTSGSLFAGTDQPKAYIHNVGTTRGNASVQFAITQYEQPYQLAFVKVSLRNPLSSGQSVVVSIFDGNGSNIMNTSTKQFSVDGALKSLKFDPVAASTPNAQFESMYITVSSVLGASIARITVYGFPIEDNLQIL